MSEAKIIRFSVPGEEAPAPKPKATKKKKRALHSSGRVPLHFRYRDVYGTSRSKVVYGKTEKEARQKKKEFLANVEAALRIDQAAKTVIEWADEWLETYKKPTVAPRTYTCYANDIRHLKAQIGRIPLKAVTQAHIVQAYNKRIGASGSALRQYRVTTRALFKSAVSNRLIAVSPAEDVKAPTGKDGTHRALSEDEIKLVIEVAKDHQFGAPVMLMLFAGLRRGEMAALNFKRDIKDGCIHVREAVTFASNQPIVGSTKTKAAVRSIPIMPPLKPHLNSQIRPLSEAAIRRGIQSFQYACEVKLNGCHKRWLPEDKTWQEMPLRCHDLRHTYATMLYDAGVDIKSAQTWLGHTDPAVTMRIYTHLSNERETAAKERLQEHLGNIFGNITKIDS